MFVDQVSSVTLFDSWSFGYLLAMEEKSNEDGRKCANTIEWKKLIAADWRNSETNFASSWLQEFFQKKYKKASGESLYKIN